MAIGYSGRFYQFGNRDNEAGTAWWSIGACRRRAYRSGLTPSPFQKSAKNVEEAHEFLNTLLEPKVIAPISDFLGYPIANKDSLALINKDITGKGRVLWIWLAASTLVVTPLTWWFQSAAPDWIAEKSPGALRVSSLYAKHRINQRLLGRS